jgi:undecaprenyl-diphosphatase
MIEWLESIDRAIVLSVNSIHSPLLDQIMWYISGKSIWIPFYLVLIYLAYRKLGVKNCLYFVLLVVLSIVLSDVVSSKIIKEFVQRYRPSHHLKLTNLLHFYQTKPGEFYRGGEYGFVSSHAANFFALATAGTLILKKYYFKLPYVLFVIAFIVSLSRIYLGVHYVSDIIGGALVGSSIAYLIWKYIWAKFITKN